MLVDMSGSMYGENLNRAIMLSTVMLECLSLLKGVRVRIRAHTNSENDSYIARIWEPGDPMTRLGLMHTQPHGCNWDGFAIQWCQQEMLDDRRGDEDMVLIVLSDGLPNGGWTYAGEPAMQHVREVNEHYERLGISTIQIAIDVGLRTEDQAMMYDNWISYQNDQQLANDLTRLLVKMFEVEA
jgi:cobalamin biosynthesis protein CobT